MLSPIRSLMLAGAGLVMLAALAIAFGFKDTASLVAGLSVLATLAGFFIWRLASALEVRFSRRDTLTGLVSRGEAMSQVSQGLAHARSIGGHVGVLSMDIERFSRVNALHGQAVGDAVLREVASRIKRLAPLGALVARMGSDEFVVVLSGCSERDVSEPVRHFCEDLVDCLNLPLDLASGEVPVRLRIGGEIVCPKDAVASLTAEDLIMHANLARSSRIRKPMPRSTGYTLFMNEMVDEATRSVEIEREMAAALRSEEFSVVFQPIVNTETLRTVKCEALLRWKSPKLGMVSPQDFIPIAERSGLIDALGSFSLDAAAAQCARWLGEGRQVAICVNVSAIQLCNESFFREVERTLRRYGVPPHMLLLELTESVVVESDPAVRLNLAQLESAGVSVALDDFGTGFSALSYLSRLNIQTIKIDKSFVHAMCEGEREMRLIELICAIGKSMDFEVVAEGVESPAQARELDRIGVHHMQGYLFSPPVPAEKVEFHFRAHNFKRPTEHPTLHRVASSG